MTGGPSKLKEQSLSFHRPHGTFAPMTWIESIGPLLRKDFLPSESWGCRWLAPNGLSVNCIMLIYGWVSQRDPESHVASYGQHGWSFDKMRPVSCDPVGASQLPHSGSATKEATKEASTSPSFALSCSFRLNPLLEESPILEIIQPRDLCLHLRLLTVESQERRNRVDHVPHRDASHTTEVRAIHLDFHV